MFLAPLADKTPTNDVPNELSISLSAFHKYKDKWKYWRALKDEGKPVSFIEASLMPKDELDVYLELDNVFEKLLAQKRDKKT